MQTALPLRLGWMTPTWYPALPPAELEAELRRLQTNGPAAMIGSTSAAAALACADVGIGMGAEPLPAADVMLLRDDLADAAAAVRISRAVDARIAQTPAWRWFTARCCRCWSPVCFTR